MEWIGIGILIAIGLYIAPLVITVILSLFAIVIVTISEVFKSIFGGRRR